MSIKKFYWKHWDIIESLSIPHFLILQSSLFQPPAFSPATLPFLYLGGHGINYRRTNRLHTSSCRAPISLSIPDKKVRYQARREEFTIIYCIVNHWHFAEKDSSVQINFQNLTRLLFSTKDLPQYEREAFGEE